MCTRRAPLPLYSVLLPLPRRVCPRPPAMHMHIHIYVYVHMHLPCTPAPVSGYAHPRPHPCCNAPSPLLQCTSGHAPLHGHAPAPSGYARMHPCIYMHILAGSGSGSGGCRPPGAQHGRMHSLARCHIYAWAHACIARRSAAARTAWLDALLAACARLASRWIEMEAGARWGCDQGRLSEGDPTYADVRLHSGRVRCMYIHITPVAYACICITPGGPPRGRSAARRTRPLRHPGGCRCSRCRRPGCRRQRS